MHACIDKWSYGGERVLAAVLGPVLTSGSISLLVMQVPQSSLLTPQKRKWRCTVAQLGGSRAGFEL